MRITQSYKFLQGLGWVGSVNRHGEFRRVRKSLGDNTWEIVDLRSTP